MRIESSRVQCELMTQTRTEAVFKYSMPPLTYTHSHTLTIPLMFSLVTCSQSSACISDLYSRNLCSLTAFAHSLCTRVHTTAVLFPSVPLSTALLFTRLSSAFRSTACCSCSIICCFCLPLPLLFLLVRVSRISY